MEMGEKRKIRETASISSFYVTMWIVPLPSGTMDNCCFLWTVWSGPWLQKQSIYSPQLCKKNLLMNSIALTIVSVEVDQYGSQYCLDYRLTSPSASKEDDTTLFAVLSIIIKCISKQLTSYQGFCILGNLINRCDASYTPNHTWAYVYLGGLA